MALPESFVERFQAIYPKDAQELLKTFDLPKPVSFRINPLKTTVESATERLKRAGFCLQPVPWYRYAFTVPFEERDGLTRSPLFQEGEIYIQSLSSMLAPLALNPQPGETILDLTAAPGGKSLMMAAQMKNRGWLSVVEPGRDRFFRLKANLERGGVTIAHYYMTDGRSVGGKCPAMFDRVMLDAPCSTEAKFKSDTPKTFTYWSERKIREMSRLQQRLIVSALKSLKPGGTLLYATCSFAPEENEAIIDRILKKDAALAIEPIALPLENLRNGLLQWKKKRFSSEVAHCVRVLPTETMDGFFLCKLRKLS
ncbi:RsmB/NOP family class I SAM-dependent RNA methyltransferase [Hydrogenimonas urashimensis]|uniref:RsmB/NOP family class I SAM-dependent RNA methyltransferase n=1 Tax=Hydrogenimonas urashimensis TaxID=2740515 RepID=UPI001916AA8E|nr:RsmB/NOP family class I SAM-dependent RNA methyltransferase [Hydrogenimonas urashimensis]